MKTIVNQICDEALSLIIEEAEGVEYVRINLYIDALDELIEKGETEKEIVGAHFFSSGQSDDIDRSNQIEIYSFQQEKMDWVEGGGSWMDTERGEDWLKETEDFMYNTIKAIVKSKESTAYETFAYRFDNLDDLEKIIDEYREKEEYPFIFFDDNGGEPDGNALLIIKEDLDETLKELIKKHNIPRYPAVVFDNEEEANTQAYDGGISCYITSADKYIVLI